MNQLTQYQLNYIATFIPQYEQGILNFICHKGPGNPGTKFNNPKFKVSIWGVKDNKQLLKWYCSYFGFKLFVENDKYKNKGLVRWTIHNNAFMDFKIICGQMIEKNQQLSVRKSEIIRSLIDRDLIKYIKLLVKLKYLRDEDLLIYVFTSRKHNVEYFGLFPHCIFKNSYNILNWIVETIPKKYMMYCNNCDVKQHEILDLLFFHPDIVHYNSIHRNHELLDIPLKKKYFDFLNKHDLLYDK